MTWYDTAIKQQRQPTRWQKQQHLTHCNSSKQIQYPHKGDINRNHTTFNRPASLGESEANERKMVASESLCHMEIHNRYCNKPRTTADLLDWKSLLWSLVFIINRVKVCSVCITTQLWHNGCNSYRTEHNSLPHVKYVQWETSIKLWVWTVTWSDQSTSN